MPKTYDRQTAKLIAALAENFPEIDGKTMQHCIQHMPRLAEVIRRQIERDAIFRYGIWRTLPRDEFRDIGFIGGDDKLMTSVRFKNVLETSGCWDDYWWDVLGDSRKIEGLKTRWAKLPFAAERLIKIPVAHFPKRPSPHVFEGTMECSIEAAARYMVHHKDGLAPGERVLFFCRLKGGVNGHDGSHFCITTAWNGEPNLSVVHEAHANDFTHIVFAERPL